MLSLMSLTFAKYGKMSKILVALIKKKDLRDENKHSSCVLRVVKKTHWRSNNKILFRNRRREAKCCLV